MMSLRKSHKSPLARKLIQLREGMGARGWTQDDSIRAMRRNRVNLSRSFIAGVEADKTDPSRLGVRSCNHTSFRFVSRSRNFRLTVA